MGLCSSDIWIGSQVSQIRPALILVDVNLGRSVDGSTLVRALNQMKIREQIKVFLYSSEAEKKLAALSDECGADGYIKKCGYDELREQLLAILAQRDVPS